MTISLTRPTKEVGTSYRTPPRPALWLMAAPYLLLGLVLALWGKDASKPLVMPDTFFNLRFGHEFLSGRWSLSDPGTVTPFATAHWTPTQWSSELGLAYVDSHFGLAGVCWVMGTLVLTFLVVVYRLARLEGGPLAAALITAVTAVIATPGLSPRAQVISYLFAAVFVAAVLRMRADGRIRWWLVPVMWIWVTAHGMWPVGLSIVAVGALGIVLETRTRRVMIRMAALLGLLVVAAATTPVGLRSFSAVLEVSARHSQITEWAPTNFMTFTNAVLAVCILGLVLASARNPSAMPWTYSLLLGLGVGWALYGSRGVPVAAAILVPCLARAVHQRFPSRRVQVRDGWGVAAMLAAASVVLAFSVTSGPGAPFEDGSWETTALAALPTDTVVLNEQTLGGYLIWRYPQLRITSYGYFDTYTDAEFSRFVRLAHAQPGWVADVEDSGAHVALLASDSPLAYGLVHALHWKVVESDSAYQLLRAPA